MKSQSNQSEIDIIIEKEKHDENEDEIVENEIDDEN